MYIYSVCPMCNVCVWLVGCLCAPFAAWLRFKRQILTVSGSIPYYWVLLIIVVFCVMENYYYWWVFSIKFYSITVVLFVGYYCYYSLFWWYWSVRYWIFCVVFNYWWWWARAFEKATLGNQLMMMTLPWVVDVRFTLGLLAALGALARAKGMASALVYARGSVAKKRADARALARAAARCVIDDDIMMMMMFNDIDDDE